METYQCSDSVLKHFLENALKKIEKDFLYSKKEIVFSNVNFGKRLNRSNTPADITDPNLTERITNEQG